MDAIRLCIGGILAACLYHSALAEWSRDVERNDGVTTTGGIREGFRAIATEGGVTVVWAKMEGPGDNNIFARRIDAAGRVLWDAVVVNAQQTQEQPAAIADGSGGVVVVWQDRRGGKNTDIYAQHLSPEGARQWGNGIQIHGGAGMQVNPEITRTNNGDFVIAWTDYRTGAAEIYAQRISPTGTLRWQTSRRVATGVPDLSRVAVAAGGHDSSIFAWSDKRSGRHLVYAQRLSWQGDQEWGTNGRQVVTRTSDDQMKPAIVSSASGGVYVVWEEISGGADYNIYAQLLNESGNRLWGDGAIAIGSGPGHQKGPQLVSDGSGGAFALWLTQNLSADPADMNVQRLRPWGEQWPNGGVGVAKASVHATVAPSLHYDGSGGVLVAWTNLVQGFYKILAQRVDGQGVLRWKSDGVALSLIRSEKFTPRIVGSLGGAAIVTWGDTRSGMRDIYAQYVDMHGYPGSNAPTLTFMGDTEGDAGGRITMHWTASPLDNYPNEVITHYSVWRSLDVSSTIGPWEWLIDFRAQYHAAYSHTALTAADGVPFRFMVTARSANQAVFWNSNVLSGTSRK